MAKYRNTKKLPVAIDLPGRSISVPGRGTFNVTEQENGCAGMIRARKKSHIQEIKEKKQAAEPAPAVPKPSLVPKITLAPPSSSEGSSSDSPGQPATEMVAPSDDQSSDKDSSGEPGEGATTDRKSKKSRRKTR